MEYVSRIISLLVELALLVRALFTDGTHFISLLARSRSAMAAENLFSENNSLYAKSAKSNYNALTTRRDSCWCYSHTVSHGKRPW